MQKQAQNGGVFMPGFGQVKKIKITLVDVKVGDNLRGKTLIFDTTVDAKEYLLANFSNPVQRIVFNNNQPYDYRISESMTGGANNRIDFMAGIQYMSSQNWTMLIDTAVEGKGWLMDSFTMPDDKDYVVAENTFTESNLIAKAITIED